MKTAQREVMVRLHRLALVKGCASARASMCRARERNSVALGVKEAEDGGRGAVRDAGEARSAPACSAGVEETRNMSRAGVEGEGLRLARASAVQLEAAGVELAALAENDGENATQRGRAAIEALEGAAAMAAAGAL